MTDTVRLFTALWPDASVARAARCAARCLALAARRPAGGRRQPSCDAAFHRQLPARSARRPCARRSARWRSSRCASSWRAPMSGAAASPSPCSPPSRRCSRCRRASASALAGLGVTLDPRPYQPHVTLARKAARAQPPAVLPALEWRADGFALVESRGGARSAYEVVAAWGEADREPAAPRAGQASPSLRDAARPTQDAARIRDTRPTPEETRRTTTFTPRALPGAVARRRSGRLRAAWAARPRWSTAPRASTTSTASAKRTGAAIDGAIQATQGGKDPAYLVTKGTYTDFTHARRVLGQRRRQQRHLLPLPEPERDHRRDLLRGQHLRPAARPDLRHRRDRQGRRGLARCPRPAASGTPTRSPPAASA